MTHHPNQSMMDNQQHRSPNEWLTEIKRLYYIVYGLTIALFGVIWYMNYTSLADTGEAFMLFEPNSAIGMYIQYGVILYTLAAIPGALYWFKRKCTVLSKIEDEAERYDKYYAYASIRIAIIAVSMPLSLFGYMVLGAYKPMLWLAAIAAIAFVFTKPSAAKTEEELRPKDDDLKY